jgi:hypothetical protein
MFLFFLHDGIPVGAIPVCADFSPNHILRSRAADLGFEVGGGGVLGGDMPPFLLEAGDRSMTRFHMFSVLPSYATAEPIRPSSEQVTPPCSRSRRLHRDIATPASLLAGEIPTQRVPQGLPQAARPPGRGRSRSRVSVTGPLAAA